MRLKSLLVAFSSIICFSTFSTLAALPPGEEEDRVLSAEEFQKWLSEVNDILTDEECFIAWQVKTEEQRSAFVREFWRSRDPWPNDICDAARSEYEAWRFYAQAKFQTAEKEGAQTDRGRILVLLGPPDWVKLADWPARRWECGGCRSSFPFEVWLYRKVTVRGVTFENLELEFVDPAMNGEFRLALPPEEKKLFLRETCMGPAMADERETLAQKLFGSRAVR